MVSWNSRQHDISLPNMNMIMIIGNNLIFLSPLSDWLEVFTLVLCVKIHERSLTLDPILPKHSIVGCAHNLLSKDVQAMTCI
jgi:hypothetical protein